MGTYKVKDARNNFKQVLDEAKAGQDVTILRNFEVYKVLPVGKGEAVREVLARLKAVEAKLADIDSRLRDLETKMGGRTSDWGA